MAVGATFFLPTSWVDSTTNQVPCRGVSKWPGSCARQFLVPPDPICKILLPPGWLNWYILLVHQLCDVTLVSSRLATSICTPVGRVRIRNDRAVSPVICRYRGGHKLTTLGTTGTFGSFAWCHACLSQPEYCYTHTRRMCELSKLLHPSFKYIVGSYS